MLSHDIKLLTIITESVLEHSLEEDIERLGARGYTITNARGKGARGVRDAGWSSDSNIRIEVLGDPRTVEAIVEHIRETYYNNYAIIIYMSDVQVIRPEKFV